MVAQDVGGQVREKSGRQRLQRHVHEGRAQGDEVELPGKEAEAARAAHEEERHLLGRINTKETEQRKGRVIQAPYHAHFQFFLPT